MFSKENKSMFSEEETRWVLGFLVPFMVAHAILYLCGYKDGSFGAPITGWIILLIFIGNSLYYWKNKRAFLKRCVLASPFALLTVVLLNLTIVRLSGSSTWYWGGGILMFILLTAGKENLKQFFVIRLVIGAILISLLAVLVILINSILAGPVK